MPLKPLAAAALLAALSTAASARQADCFDSGVNFACQVEEAADGSFVATSAEYGEVNFLVTGDRAERLNYDASQGRAFRAGIYRRVQDTPGCWQDVDFDEAIFCVWD